MLNPVIQKELIKAGRNFTKGYREKDPYQENFESDQSRKLPQPPLVKAPVSSEREHIILRRDFSELELKNDLISKKMAYKNARECVSRAFL